MRKLALAICGWLFIITGMAQPAVIALENKPHTPQERYYLMKTNSETFQDYKVIKEYILDRVWKVVTDSLGNREKQLAGVRVKIDSLQNELNRARGELKSKADSMTDIVFASSHIKVFGVNFSKSSFLVIASVVFVVINLAVLLLLFFMREMRKFVNESKLIVTSVNNELEDYKHKALEKQTKLARELQTERNKLLELREQIKH